MANLTLVIDDAVLRIARVKALQQGTSVNAICREAITRFAGTATDQRGRESINALRELARRAKPSGPGAPAWPGRERLYDEALRERGLSAKRGRR